MNNQLDTLELSLSLHNIADALDELEETQATKDLRTEWASMLISIATRIVIPKEALHLLDVRVEAMGEHADQLHENAGELDAEVRSGFRHWDDREMVHEKRHRANQLEDQVADYKHERNPYWDVPVTQCIAIAYNVRDVISQVVGGANFLEATKYIDDAALKLMLIPAEASAAASIGDAVWARRDIWYSTPDTEDKKSIYTCAFYRQKGFVTCRGITEGKRWYDVEFLDTEGNKVVLEKLTSEFDFTTTEPANNDDLPF